MQADSECLLNALREANDRVTVGELKARCQSAVETPQVEVAASTANQDRAKKGDLFDRRISSEQEVAQQPFALLPHKPTYLLAGYYFNSVNEAPFQAAFPARNVDFDSTELKFQISFKVPVATGLFDDRAAVFFGYTNRSFWQAFNKEASSPFRETNHEPEAWISIVNDMQFLGLTNRLVRLGAVHQSNGQAGSLSRSWNRLYADFVFEASDNFYFSFKPWYRIEEEASKDDNPDIEDYLGNFEWQGVYKNNDHTLGLMLRNNLDTQDNRGAVQLDWSFPLFSHLRGYVQWFNGYGESLIDYNHSVNTVGAGVQLTDWL